MAHKCYYLHMCRLTARELIQILARMFHLNQTMEDIAKICQQSLNLSCN